MTYALFNSATSEIVQGPWGKLPGRLDWGDGSQVSPVEVGMTNGDLIVVSVVDTDTAPDRWHTDTGGRSYSLTGSVLTVTRTYSKTKAPTASMVHGEAERRISDRYSTVKQMRALIQWLQLKEIVEGGGTLTAGQEARLTAYRNAFAWMVSVDDAADTIAAMDPIPDDFNADNRWPA